MDHAAMPKAGQPKPESFAERHPYGPRALSALVPCVTRAGFARQPPATAQVMADWSLIVGPALAARTRPCRLTAGTLTIACAGPTALELQHASDLLIGRVNQHVGHMLVQRIRIMQQAVEAAPPPAPPRIGPATRQAVERSLADMPPGPVRDALAALGLVVGCR